MDALEVKLAAAAGEGENNKRTVEVRCGILSGCYLMCAMSTLQQADRVPQYSASIAGDLDGRVQRSSCRMQNIRLPCLLQSLNEAVAAAEARSRELYEANSRLEAHVQASASRLLAELESLLQLRTPDYSLR